MGGRIVRKDTHGEEEDKRRLATGEKGDEERGMKRRLPGVCGNDIMMMAFEFLMIDHHTVGASTGLCRP